MPSIITHDTFGREIYSNLTDVIGHSEDEKQAFLLGCQGPDVFFYGIINPLLPQVNKIGQKLHRNNCSETICALAMSIPQIVEDTKDEEAPLIEAREIARAYCLGYLMHFGLDSKIHPFVFSQQFAYCDAGVPGLDRKNMSEVHVEIECELDELVLSVKREQTISTFDPSTQTLKANNRMLNIITKMFEFALPISHKETPAPNAYRMSVKAYRQTLRWLYSVTGVKRELIGRFETMFRQHSYLRAMIHKNVKLKESIFDNHEHQTWKDPWDSHNRKESFWDLYNCAIKEGHDHVVSLAKAIDENCATSFNDGSKEASKQRVRNIFSAVLQSTQNQNFYGCNEEITDPKTGRPRNMGE